jgi:hypothetical protein
VTTSSHKFRISFVCALATAVLVAFGCGGVGGGTYGGGGGSGGGSQLTIATQTALPKGLIGQFYSAKLQATGGAPPYSWSTQLLGIDGLKLATDGTISGTPNVQGTFIPYFVVTDSKGTTASAGVEIDIYSPPNFTTPANLPDLNVGLRAYIDISVNGGVQPYTFSLAPSSTIPSGLTFSNNGGVGLIQGTPTTAGTFSFTVQLTDSFSPPLKISQTFTLNVLNRLVLPNSTLPDAVQNVAYTEYVQPAGGTPPYHFGVGKSFMGQSLPSGILFDTASGKIYGTPAVANTPFSASLFVTITDSASPPASIDSIVSFTVQPPLSIQTTVLPDSARGLYYNGTIYIIGGRSPYKFQTVNGTMPNGLTAASTHGNSFYVTGQPTTDGLFKFTVQISDSYETPNVVTQDFQIRISDQMALSGPTFVQILYNQSYSTTFPATGGFPPYTWKIDRTVPGFTFYSTTGTLSGTANGGSFSSPNISVHDSSNPPLTASYYFFTLQAWGKLVISTTSMPTIATGSTTWLQPVLTGGGSPYQWSVSSGTLPPGMTLRATDGAIFGSPTAAGTYAFTLAVSDANTGTVHQSTSRQFNLAVKDRGQMTRNDTIAQAIPVSNLSLLASISPYSDPSTNGPDMDVYQATATPGSLVPVYVSANIDFIQPPNPNSLFPVVEIVDGNGIRYQSCSSQQNPNSGPYNFPCINGLDGNFSSSAGCVFQVPGTGTTPVSFYVRVSDARGDARPDFIYTLRVSGVN